MQGMNCVFAAAVAATMMGGVCAGQTAKGWTVYNGGADGDHYSELAQINRTNVQQLKLAWKFDTGETGGIQDNPLIVGRTLYAYTPTQKVIALDAATGALKMEVRLRHSRQPAGERNDLLG